MNIRNHRKALRIMNGHIGYTSRQPAQVRCLLCDGWLGSRGQHNTCPSQANLLLLKAFLRHVVTTRNWRAELDAVIDGPVFEFLKQIGGGRNVHQRFNREVAENLLAHVERRLKAGG